MEEFRRKMLDSNDVYAQDSNIIVDDSEQSDENGIKTKGLKLNDNLDFNNVHIKGTLEVDGESTFNKDVKTKNNAHFIDNGNVVVSQIEESIEKVEPEREIKDGYNLYAVTDVDKENNKIKFYYSKFAPLDNNNLIPASFLPSYVDDVIEVSNFYKTDGTEIEKNDESSMKALFSGKGDDGTIYTKQKGVSGKIYIFNAENGSISKNQVSIYRWSGSQFVEIADFDALENWCKDNLVSYSVIENNNGEIKYVLKSTNDGERGSVGFKATNGSNLTYDKNKNQIIINVEYSGDNWVAVNNANKTIKHKTHSTTTETIESSNDSTLIGPNGKINIPSISFDSNGHKSDSSSKTVNMVGLATDKNDGFLSKEDKGKINGIVEGANYYEAKMIMSNSDSGTQLSASNSNAYINFVESYKNPKDTVKTENHIDTSIGLVAGDNVTIVGTLNSGKGIITFNGYDTTIKAGSNVIPADETVNVLNTITESKNGFDREYSYGTVTVLTSKGVSSLIGKIDYVDEISFANNSINYTKKVSTTPISIITFKGEGGISVDTSNKTLTIKHSNAKILAGNDKINATEISPATTQLTIPYLSYDEYGHITEKTNQTIKLSDFASKKSLDNYVKKEDEHDYTIKTSTKGYGLYNEDNTLKGVEIDLTPYAKEAELNSYKIKSTDSGYGLFDKTDKMQGSEIVMPDLSPYAKKAEVHTYQVKKSTNGYSLYDDTNTVKGTEIVIPNAPDLTPYVKKTDLDPYAKKEDIPDYEVKVTEKGYRLYDDDNNPKGVEIEMPDLSSYAKKTDLDNYNYYTSNLIITDSKTATTAKTSTSNSTYLNLIESNKAGTKSVKNSIKVIGSGQTSVKSNGTEIVVTSQQNQDNDTKYSMTVGSGQTVNNEKVEVNPRIQLVENNNTLKSTSVVVGADWIKAYSNGNTDISIAHKKISDMNETIEPTFSKVGYDSYGHIVSSSPVGYTDIKPFVDNLVPEYSIVENPDHQGYYYLTDGTEQKGSEFKIDNQVLRIKASGNVVAGYDGTEVKEVDIAGAGSIVVTSPRTGSIVIRGTDTVYTLPTASSSVLGGVKIGNNITIASDGTISVEKPIYYQGATTDYGTVAINDNTVSLSQAVGKINDTTYKGEIFNDYGNNVASAYWSHAEGRWTKATGFASHAEGQSCLAQAEMSHAEGASCEIAEKASYSHAEGHNTNVQGVSAHAEGDNTQANGSSSHSEGKVTIANGAYSHAQNSYTIASGSNQTVLGRYNVEDTGDRYSVIIGNGNDVKRDNMFTADWNGVMTSYGDTSDYVLQNTDGSTISLRNLVMSSGSKSSVSYSSTVTSGTELGRLTIDNVNYSIYMPSTSGVVTSTTYKNNITDVKNTVIGTITVSGSTNYNVSIPTINNSASYKDGLSIGSASYGDTTTNYYVPYATSSSYGLVKAGTNTTISNGVISSTDTKYTLNLSGQNLSLVNSNNGTTVKTIALPQTSIGNLIFTDGSHSVYYNGTTSTIKLGGSLSVDNTNNQINAKNTTYSLNKTNNIYTLTDSDGTDVGVIAIPNTLRNPNSLILKNSNTSIDYNGEAAKTINLGNNIDFTYNSSSKNYTLNAKNTTYNIKTTANGYGLYDSSNVMQGSEIVIPNLSNYAKKSDILNKTLTLTDSIETSLSYNPNEAKTLRFGSGLNFYEDEDGTYNLETYNDSYTMKKTTNGYGLYNSSNALIGTEIVIPNLSNYATKDEVGITSIKSSSNKFGNIGVSTSGHTATLSLSGSPIWYDSTGTIRLAPNITGSNPTVAFGSDGKMTIVGDGYSHSIDYFHMLTTLQTIHDILYELCKLHNIKIKNGHYRYSKLTTLESDIYALKGEVNSTIARTQLL